ncbi:hypothetical protein DFA_11189 [Cavenderia fasciculata]|uniref:Uncharacterized protein n=1 Tax=Cavenderia fasciculata TaxID=261658 RepID=F4QFC1_CACFS|nr:uncharacterized protein DFA_11189 [Cavenderia fasciculata]EGG13428.1 hypothetical protein DFA_11189 [Cavenderia fasciculata]|eukprot:XP_004350132.1 hypothetical protein DFA_11189 [Cavenderia fasciculata]
MFNLDGALTTKSHKQKNIQRQTITNIRILRNNTAIKLDAQIKADHQSDKLQLKNRLLPISLSFHQIFLNNNDNNNDFELDLNHILSSERFINSIINPLKQLLILINNSGRIQDFKRERIITKFLFKNTTYYKDHKDSLIESNRVNESIIQTILNTLYHCFTSQRISSTTEKSISPLLIATLKYSKYIIDKNTRFSIIFNYLEYLVMNYQQIAKTVDSRDQYINSLVLFYNLIFNGDWVGKEEGKEETTDPLQYLSHQLISNIKQLQTIISNEKFLNPIIGLLNFKLYSFINNYNNNIDQQPKKSKDSSSSSSSLSLETILNGNECYQWIKQQQQQNNRKEKDILIRISEMESFNFIEIIKQYSEIKPSLFISTLKKDGDSYFLFLVKSLRHQQPLTSTNTIDQSALLSLIYVPYHLYAVTNQTKNSINQYYQFIQIWYKVLDENNILNLENDIFKLKGIPESFFITFIYLCFVNNQQKEKEEEQNVMMMKIVNRFSELNLGLFKKHLNQTSKRSFMTRLYNIINQLDISSIIFSILLKSYESSLQQGSIQSMISKCLNRLTVGGGSDSLTDQDEELQSNLIQDLQLITFIDCNKVLERLLKSALTNKNQQQFMANIIVNHLGSFIPGDMMDIIVKNLFNVLNSLKDTVEPQTITNLIQFIESLLEQVSQNSQFMRDRLLVSLQLNLIIPSLSIISTILQKIILDIEYLLLSKYIINLNDSDMTLELVLKKLVDVFNSILYYMEPNQLEIFYNICKLIGTLLTRGNQIDDNRTKELIGSFETKVNWKLFIRLKHYFNQPIEFKKKNQQQQSLTTISSSSQLLPSISTLLKQPVVGGDEMEFPLDLIITFNFIDLCFILPNHIEMLIQELIENIDIGTIKFGFERVLLFCLAISLPYNPPSHYTILVDHLLPHLIKNNIVSSSDTSTLLFRIIISSHQIFNQYQHNNDNDTIDSTEQQTLFSFYKNISNQLRRMITSTTNDNDSYLHHLKMCIRVVDQLQDQQDYSELFYMFGLSILEKIQPPLSKHHQSITNKCIETLQLIKNSSDTNNPNNTKQMVLLNKLNGLLLE